LIEQHVLRLLGSWLRDMVGWSLYLLGLLWRCIYPFLASAFLVVFFCVATQGTELLKIFIAGERKVYQHWSLAPGFALACGTIWWVSRKILLTPWHAIGSRTPAQEVHPWAVFWLPALLALTPMLLVAQEAYYVESTSQQISVGFCEAGAGADCRPFFDPKRPRQVFLFLLFHTVLLAIMVFTARLDKTTREATARRVGRIGIGTCLLFAIGLWLTFVWSGPSAGEMASANFVRHQMMIQRAMGSVTIVLLAVISWTILGGILLTIWAKRALGYTLVALPLALVIFSSSFRYRDNAIYTVAPDSSVASAPTLSESLLAFHTQHAADYSNEPTDTPIPIYLAAAAGGGLRAAYWTASVLADLQDADKRFGRHLFIVSGVSGGGLGAATFVAALHKNGCPHQISVEAQDSVGDCVRRVLEDVSLAPVLAATLYPDFWRSLWPSALQDVAWRWLGLNAAFGAPVDRARVLEHSWETSFAYCTKHPQPVDVGEYGLSFPRPFRCAARTWTREVPADTTQSDVLGMTVRKLWEPAPAVEQNSKHEPPYLLPNLIINGTDVATGKRLLSSNLALNPAEFPDAYIARTDDAGVLNLPLSTVVHNGARFPVVSPAGRIANYDGRSVLPPSNPTHPVSATVSAGGHASPTAAHAQLMCNQQAFFLTDHVRELTTELNPCKVVSQRVHRIVDGGYFDNSGLITTIDILDEISQFNLAARKKGMRPLRPAVLIIDNGGWSYATPTASHMGAFESIFGTYTRTPNARAARDIAEHVSRAVPDAPHDTFVFNLDRSGNDVPGLGWALSEASTNQMIIASAQSNYHQRVRQALAPLSRHQRERHETDINFAQTWRVTRCIFAISNTTLIAEAKKWCPSE
jgi:hypothetical protein